MKSNPSKLQKAKRLLVFFFLLLVVLLSAILSTLIYLLVDLLSVLPRLGKRIASEAADTRSELARVWRELA